MPNDIIWQKTVLDGCGAPNPKLSRADAVVQTCYGTNRPFRCLEYYVFFCVNLISEFSILGVLSTLFVFFVSSESFVCSFDQGSLRSRQPNPVVRAKLALVQTFLQTEQTHLS